MNRFLSYAAGHPMTFEEFCNFAHELGFVGVELIPDLSPNLPEEFSLERRSTLRGILNRLELSCTVHNIFYDINHTSLVPSVRQFAYEITKVVMAFAEDIGASALIIHPGYRFSPWRSKPDQAKMFDDVVSEVYPRLGALSLQYGIPLLMENGNYYYCALRGSRNPLHIGIDYEQ